MSTKNSFLSRLHLSMRMGLTVLVSLLSLGAAAQSRPLWMRHSAISPDGKTIAFSYKGDLYTVPVTGGQALQLTSNAAYDSYPVWSPNGEKLAFSSAREGSIDVFLINKTGGAPLRLTTDGGKETPLAFLDNDHVLFEATGMLSPTSIIFPDNTFSRVFQVETREGCRPTVFSEISMPGLSVGPMGDILYHDLKGYEDPWRKHHTSPICRSIWLKRAGKYTKLSHFIGENRNPVWGEGDTYYYLSEEDGTFNVYRNNLSGTAKQQLTHFKGNPVRFLTRSTDGILSFGYDGELYTLREGQQPQRVSVSIVADRNDVDLQRQTLRSGATEIALSPNGKEIAFVLRGDVYVTSVEYATTRQITDTPEQERSVDFAPDGRGLVYAAERNGLWQIYQSTIKNKKDDLFTYASEIVEEQLVKSDKTSFQPVYSPDGKSVAYLEDRTTLRAVDVKTHQLRTLMEGKFMFSYSDGDQWFSWSPDSRWLLASYIGTGGWNNSDVALVSADGKGEIRNLTNSGYNDGNAKWVLGGKAMVFESDRAGYRSHGSWGAESDAYIMFFDLDAYERFRMSKEEYARWKETSDAEKKESEKKAKEEAKNAKEKKKNPNAVKPEKTEPLQLDLDNCRDRVVRLTVNSSHLGDCLLNKEGDAFYYLTSFEGRGDLWKHSLREGKTEIVAKNIGRGGLIADKDFKSI